MKGISNALAFLALALALAGCEPEPAVDENSAEFEASLKARGLEPLGPGAATLLLGDKTVEGRYGGGEGGWLEYYSSGGVSVFQPDAAQDPRRRIVYFGTWWSEGDQTCFSYPERRLDCFRVYHDGQSIYFIRIRDSGDRPAGSLAVVGQTIKAGNTEKYPFVSN